MQTSYEPVSDLERRRRAYRRKRSARSALVSLASLAAFSFAVWFTLSRSEGWGKVQAAFFDPARFAEALPQVLKGLLTNVRVLGVSVVGVGLLGTLLAVTRTRPSPPCCSRCARSPPCTRTRSGACP